MAAGAGLDVGQREADFMAQTAAQMTEALIHLLCEIGRKHADSYSDNFSCGMKVLSKHVSDGGLVKQSIVDEADAVSFENALRRAHVPYAEILVKEEPAKCVFLTRAGAVDGVRGLPDDTALLEKAWEEFATVMMERLQEADVETNDTEIAEERLTIKCQAQK